MWIENPILYRMNGIRFPLPDPTEMSAAVPLRTCPQTRFRGFSSRSSPQRVHARILGVNPFSPEALNIIDLVRFLQQVFGNLHGLCVRAPAAPRCFPPDRPCSPHFVGLHDESLLLVHTASPLHGAKGRSRMGDLRGPPQKHS